MNEEKYTVPAYTMNEHPADYELAFAIPGVGKEDAELHVEGRTLTLKTHAKFQNPAGFRQVVAEFDRENYAISVDLPELANLEKITAALENGVLRLTVAKRPETQARKIAIA